MKYTATLLGLLSLAGAQYPAGGGGGRPGNGNGNGNPFPGRPGQPGPPRPPPGGPGPTRPPPPPPPPGTGPGGGGDEGFNPLEHLGANSPWFPGPNVFGISPEAPEGCKVDQAVYIARHGSRYPDPGAYNGWLTLYETLQAANFTATGPLAFLPEWEPVIDFPDQQLRQLSPGGYDELQTLGVELRTRYPGWYEYGSPFRVFSNDYERTVDSARLFARGYLGPNATTLGQIHPILASDDSVVANSLATSDSCPTYADRSGRGYADVWDSIYLPPIAERLNGFVTGDLNLTADNVSNFPYLCGFETQITRRVSPFCAVFTPDEILQYEYRQDLRYWYGTGPGSFRNTSVMLPVIQGVVDLLQSGPDTPVKGAEPGQQDTVGPLSVAFTHDNQINQMASSLGIFDAQPPLAADAMNSSRIYVSSRNNPMRGTVAFERLTCGAGATEDKYLRLLLNDAVYPVPACSEGPGMSCPLQRYNEEVLARKWAEAGDFEEFCELPEGSVTTSETGGVTFFTDLTLAAIRTVQP